ncbi:MAG: hypothetical protein ACK5MU_04660 [Candidatus Saccharimonadales bacterium]
MNQGSTQEDTQSTFKRRSKKLICIGIPILVLAIASTFLTLRLFNISVHETTLQNVSAAGFTSADTADGAIETAVCAYNDKNALVCAPADAESGSNAIPEGYIICIKDTSGTITCTDGNGNVIPATCTTSASGTLSCVRENGELIENILTCTPADAKNLSCIREDGKTVEIIIDKEIIIEVEKEVIKEVEKEVIVEKEIIVDKTSPILTARHQTPTEATNSDVTLTLSFNKEIKLPDGWNYGASKKEIRRTFSGNVSTTLSVTDFAGNSGQTNIQISNIDKAAPSCSSKVSGSGESFTYTISCSEAVTITDWGKISPSEYSKHFTSSQYSKQVQATDLAGNSVSVVLY